MALKHGPIALTSHNGLPIWIYGVAILIFVVIVRPAIRQIAAPLHTFAQCRPATRLGGLQTGAVGLFAGLAQWCAAVDPDAVAL